MLQRTILIAAMLVAPLALSPASVSAQARGMDQATTASANAQATNRPTQLPRGMDSRPEGQALPPGLALTREAAPQEPAADDSCPISWNPLTSQLEDCHGNPISGS